LNTLNRKKPSATDQASIEQRTSGSWPAALANELRCSAAGTCPYLCAIRSHIASKRNRFIDSAQIDFRERKNRTTKMQWQIIYILFSDGFFSNNGALLADAFGFGLFDVGTSCQSSWRMSINLSRLLLFSLFRSLSYRQHRRQSRPVTYRFLSTNVVKC
jgi:hypothetical protein